MLDFLGESDGFVVKVCFLGGLAFVVFCEDF